MGRYGGCHAVSKGLLEEFDRSASSTRRWPRTASSEPASAPRRGLAAHRRGHDPQLQLLALDPIVNGAATLPHMSGGQFAVPLVVRMATGGGRQLAAQHSHSFEGWFAHMPGLKLLAPATVEDARRCSPLRWLTRNPVLLFEHIMLYAAEDELDPAVTAGRH